MFFLILIGAGLKCYHCLEKPKSTEKHLACAYFDKSEKFHKECTHSSFCMKRTSQFQLHNGTYVTIHLHKCADQSHKTMIQDSNGDWKWAQLFRRDLYNEGCFPHNTPSMLTTDSYHCFCSTDLCNAATLVTNHVPTFLATIVGVGSGGLTAWLLLYSTTLLFINRFMCFQLS
ncbi:unnamed protein product [Orchesella dallaii]|uniref:Protein quiver n=1 Tax=Orchesella dallaii TaxID=48710 RepID=A0ABP1PQT6_9HEXA